MESGSESVSLEEIKRRLDLSHQQALAFSRDFVRIYKQERERRLKLEEMHQKLRAIVNSISDAMVATDKNFTIHDFNSAFSRLFPEVNSPGAHSLDRFLSLQLLQKQIIAMNKENRNAITFEYVMNNGNERSFWVSLAKIVQAGMEETGYVFIFRDITEMRRFEKFKSNFIRLASQEVQVPLNGLLGLLYLLYDTIHGRLSEEERSYFNFLINSGKNLQKMIEEMMWISPLQEMGELNKCFVQLDGLVVENLKKSEEDISNLEVEVQFEVRERGAILIDPDLMMKALSAIQNLLFSYTRKEGKIVIELFQSLDDLQLRYYCPDISEEDWQELREMLYSQSNFQEGIEVAGVGLALAREIVEWNGGNVQMGEQGQKELNLLFPSWSKVVGITSGKGNASGEQ